jgi:hypothetical protein
MSANALTGRGDQKISRWRQFAGWLPCSISAGLVRLLLNASHAALDEILIAGISL